MKGDHMKINLKDLKPKPANLQLRHPLTDEDLEGAVLHVVGTDSKEYYQAQMAQAKATFKNGKMAEDLEVINEAALDVYCAVVVGWEGAEEGFFGVQATPDAIKAVMRDPELQWIRTQVDEFVADRSNFIQGLSKN
jgi:hypothetical protein